MLADEIAKLENEISIGSSAKASYDSFIKNFIEAKRQDLYIAFQDTSVMAPDLLQELKRQLMTLNGLENEILSLIDTGKLASKQLADNMEKH